jgi:signal transduction histidine kinase
VTDNGEGIPEEILSQVFEPFFTTKEIGKGTGLGLSMVHGLVHHAQGHIHIDSQPKRGTSFKLFFPAIRNDAGLASNHQNGEEHAIGM